MAINPVTSLSGNAAINGPAGPSSAPRTSTQRQGEIPFADLVKGLIQDTSQQQFATEESVRKMVSGETDSIHDVVLTASRADLAFRLVMEIRNRLISSYQEVMRMQV
jgi:flagellar hook-basal body complex protein FliE